MALFELIDPTSTLPPPGPWRTVAGVSSFATGAEADGPLWRVGLPAEPSVALAALADAERAVGSHEALVEGAATRIDALALTGGGVSFGGESLPAPEQRLLAVVRELRAGPGAASFGTGDGVPLWAEAEQRIRQALDQARAAVGNLAVVETRVDGRLVARTSVSWTGDLRSLLPAAAPGAYASLHERALALALRSRAALLKTLATVLRGAAIVAAMAGSPAGALLALPAAWRFVEELLEARGA